MHITYTCTCIHRKLAKPEREEAGVEPRAEPEEKPPLAGPMAEFDEAQVRIQLIYIALPTLHPVRMFLVVIGRAGTSNVVTGRSSDGWARSTG